MYYTNNCCSFLVYSHDNIINNNNVYSLYLEYFLCAFVFIK